MNINQTCQIGPLCTANNVGTADICLKSQKATSPFCVPKDTKCGSAGWQERDVMELQVDDEIGIVDDNEALWSFERKSHNCNWEADVPVTI